MVRIRTIPQCAALLMAEDENTAISTATLRRMAKCGEIPIIRVASKCLINYDLLLDMLNHPKETPPVQVDTYGTIRRIER